jgi:hypothetical protein
VGLVRVKKGEATVETIEKELRNLIHDKWLWKVKQVADNEYVAMFPNKQILEALSRSNGVELALYNISATLTPTKINMAVSSVLQEGWVQLFYVPDFARTIDAVTMIAEKGGEVLAVDELSLIKEGPVRVELRGRDISKIRGFLEVFVEKDGFDIKFVPESNKPPPGGNPQILNQTQMRIATMGITRTIWMIHQRSLLGRQKKSWVGGSSNSQSESRPQNHKGKQHGTTDMIEAEGEKEQLGRDVTTEAPS